MRKKNKERAARIDAALKPYSELMSDGPYYETEPADDKLSDILTDLLHWAEREKVDFEDALRRAKNDYYVEQKGRITCKP